VHIITLFLTYLLRPVPTTNYTGGSYHEVFDCRTDLVGQLSRGG